MGELMPRPRPLYALDFDGERYTTSFGGQTGIEHWHRYLVARELVRGRDTLDIASGEGYGSALLAQTARQVVAVELSAATVAHAQEMYRCDNLRYLEGNALSIPLDDACVDVVVSFETIEHVYEHDRFLSEIRRVLRPGGLLIVSTPDRDNYSPATTPANPYHKLELTSIEFRTLLSRHFRSVRMQGQRILLGSALLGDECSDGVSLVFERRGEDHFESSVGPARAKYLVALATDGTLPTLPDSIYVDTDRLLHVDGPVLERIVNGQLPSEATIAERDRIIADLSAGRDLLDAKVKEFIGHVAERDRIIADLSAGRDLLDAKVKEFIGQVAERDRVIADLRARRNRIGWWWWKQR